MSWWPTEHLAGWRNCSSLSEGPAPSVPTHAVLYLVVNLTPAPESKFRVVRHRKIGFVAAADESEKLLTAHRMIPTSPRAQHFHTMPEWPGSLHHFLREIRTLLQHMNNTERLSAVPKHSSSPT
jgi:hypothetical protein